MRGCVCVCVCNLCVCMCKSIYMSILLLFFSVSGSRQLAAWGYHPIMTMTYRNKVLSLYREIFRLARGWQSATGQLKETEEDKRYIIGEAKELFKKNKNVCTILYD